MPAEQAAALSDWFDLGLSSDDEGDEIKLTVESGNTTTMSVDATNETEASTFATNTDDLATTTKSMADKKGIDVITFYDDAATTTRKPRPTSRLIELLTSTASIMDGSDMKKMEDEPATVSPSVKMTTPIVMMMMSTESATEMLTSTQAPTAEPTVAEAEILAHDSSIVQDAPMTTTQSKTSTTTTSTRRPSSSSTTQDVRPASAANVVATEQPMGDATVLPKAGGNAAGAIFASSLLAIVVALCICL